MKVPNHEVSIIEKAKVTEYLLSPTNEDGKAGFFTRYGFALEQWEVLVQALRIHIANNDVAKTMMTEHGTKYIVEGRLLTPDGRNPPLRTVWLVEEGMSTVRLITAYPLRGSKS